MKAIEAVLRKLPSVRHALVDNPLVDAAPWTFERWVFVSAQEEGRIRLSMRHGEPVTVPARTWAEARTLASQLMGGACLNELICTVNPTRPVKS